MAHPIRPHSYIKVLMLELFNRLISFTLLLATSLKDTVYNLFILTGRWTTSILVSFFVYKVRHMVRCTKLLTDYNPSPPVALKHHLLNLPW